jgi:hypothetical protein
MRALSIAGLVAALASSSPAAVAESRATETPENLATARELFLVTFERAGVQLNARAVEHAWPGMENALRTKNPGLDTGVLADLRREFERIRLQKMRELLKDVPAVYARHLNQEEMQEVIRFYRTPAGTKLMQVVPAVVAEIFAIALPGMPDVVSATHEEFLKLARERGYIK